MGEYKISLTHEFHSNTHTLDGIINIEETGLEKKPYFMVNGILVDDNEELLLAGQIIRTKEGTNLILGKSHGTDKHPRIIYNLKRYGVEKDLPGTYRGKWTNLRGGLVIALNDYRTRAKGLLDSISTHSLVHGASVELKKN